MQATTDDEEIETAVTDVSRTAIQQAAIRGEPLVDWADVDGIERTAREVTR